jgi:hypothetical protein
MNRKNLLKKKNVVLVYTGKKVVGGVETDRTAIRVGVVEKVPLAQLAKKDMIPKKIKGRETDVFQTEEIRALAVDRKSKIRPAPGGCSIGHPEVTAGTLGMVVKKKGIRHILSNNHVLANTNEAEIGDQTWQPGRADGGKPADTIGLLADFVRIRFTGEVNCPIVNFVARLFKLNITSQPINKVDCAISKPVDDEYVSDEILEIGKPTGFGKAKIGDKVKKSGRTTALTQGQVIATDGVSNVNYGSKIAVFEDQIVTTAISEGGDSGSAVLNEANKVFGLLFAGSSSLTLINNITNVIDALGLDK